MVRKIVGLLLLATIAAVLVPLAASAALPRFVRVQTSQLYIEAGEDITFTISTTDAVTHVFAPIDGTRVQATRVTSPAPPAGTRNWTLTFTPAASQIVTVHANTRNAVADAAILTIPVSVSGETEPVAINSLTRNTTNLVAGDTVRFTIRTPASVTHVFAAVDGTRVQARQHQTNAATGEITWRLYATPQETQRLTFHANNANSTAGSVRRNVNVEVGRPTTLESTLTPVPTPTPVQLVGTWYAITIEGNAQFVNNTQAALNVIRRSPLDYALVLRYLGVIRQGVSSGMWAFLEPPTFVVGHATYTASPTWYASAILHDAVHSKQFHQHLAQYGYVPPEVWTGMEAEMEALDIQIAFLIRIGAPQHEIDWAKSLRDTVWWAYVPWW